MTDVIDEGPVASGHASGEPVAEGESGTLGGVGSDELLVSDVLIGDADKVVSARGTEDGLVLRIDGGAEWATILNDLESFLGGRRRFFEGGEVSIEWLERLPTREQCSELEDLLKAEYGLTVVTRRRRPQRGSSVDAASATPTPPAESAPASDPKQREVAGARTQSAEELYGGDPASSRGEGVTIPLFDEKTAAVTTEGLGLVEKIEQLAAGRESDSFDLEGVSAASQSSKRLSQVRKMLGDDLFYEDDANAKVVFGTVRSGQRIETPFSLVVIGDVNPGADLVAGGDIVIVGSLRGTAHASAYDDDAFDSVIIAMHMQPMQLRIGSIISRGSDDVVEGVEIARIENRRIVVESFNPRAPISRKSY